MFVYLTISTLREIFGTHLVSSLRISSENISETAPEHLMLVQKYLKIKWFEIKVFNIRERILRANHQFKFSTQGHGFHY